MHECPQTRQSAFPDVLTPIEMTNKETDTDEKNEQDYYHIALFSRTMHRYFVTDTCVVGVADVPVVAAAVNCLNVL